MSMHKIVFTSEELAAVLDALRYSATCQLSQWNADLADRVEQLAMTPRHGGFRRDWYNE